MIFALNLVQHLVLTLIFFLSTETYFPLTSKRYMGQFVPNLQKKALLTFTTKEHLMEMTEILLCQSDLYFSQVPEWLRWALSLMESLIWKIAEMFINCNSVPDVFRRPKCQPVLLLSLLAPLTFWQQLNRSHTWTDWQVSLFWGKLPTGNIYFLYFHTWN